MAKFGKKVQDTVKGVMDKMKQGKLKTGTGKKVTNRKQAVAIGLSEAREKGAKVPAPKKSGSSRKPAARKKTASPQRGPVSRKKTSSARRSSTAKRSAAKVKR